MRFPRADPLPYGKCAIAGDKNAEYPTLCHGNNISCYMCLMCCMLYHAFLYANDRVMYTIQQQKL